MTARRRSGRSARQATTFGAGRPPVAPGSLALVAVVMIAAAGLAGASGEVADPQESEPTAPPVVDCESRDQIIPARHRPGRVPRRTRKRSIAAGPVLFSGARQWRGVRVKRPRRGLRPAKIPFLVEANRTVRVSVKPPAGRRAVIAVGRSEGPPPHVARGRSVELRSCPPSATVAGRRVGKRTPFTAGFRIDGPMCLRVRVDVEGREAAIARRIAFGNRPRCTPRA